jgi:hypothetical protein
MNKSLFKLSLGMTLIHRCTWVGEGRGYLNFLPTSLGGSRLSGKIAGGSPILGFIAFLLTSVLKLAGGVL